MPQVNRQICLAARPGGFPKEGDFELVEAPVPEAGADEMLVRVIYLSLDPYMRGRMSDAASYARPLQIGEVMVGGAVGEVVQSNAPDFASGDIVVSHFGWQKYGIAKAKEARKIDPSLAPLSTAVGVLGMPGLTAYFGLLEIGRPKAGETVVVSAASGAVGAVVGQIAKIQGCRAVGIAGSDRKIGYITRELGFDAGINYKSAADLGAALGEACPNGIAVYFDNVGGTTTDTIMHHINQGARIAICGMISQYNLEQVELGPRGHRALLINRARMEGFLVFDFAERYPEGLARLAFWIQEGRLKYLEDIAEGLENAPKAFIGMLKGENFGKQLVRIGPEPG